MLLSSYASAIGTARLQDQDQPLPSLSNKGSRATAVDLHTIKVRLSQIWTNTNPTLQASIADSLNVEPDIPNQQST